MFNRKLVTTLLLSSFVVSGCSQSTFTPTAAAETRRAAEFKDIGGHWAKDSINLAVSKGYVDGYVDGTFLPDKKVSRAEFIKLTMSGLGKYFTPEDGNEWYRPYVAGAVNGGILTEGEFSGSQMNEPITRQEMARIVVRAAAPSVKPATDAEFMYEATKAGLIQGMSGGELGKGEATTRAQSVTVIERILTVKSGGKLPVDKAAVSYAEVDWRGTNLFTMWNSKPVQFPLEITLGSGLTLTIHQMIVVDITDPNGAYYQAFKQMEVQGLRGPLSQHYAIGFKVSVTNETVKQHENTALPFFIGADRFNWGYSNQEITFILDQVGTTNGWMMFSQKKEIVDDGIKQVGFFRNIHLLKLMNGEAVTLNKE